MMTNAANVTLELSLSQLQCHVHVDAFDATPVPVSYCEAALRHVNVIVVWFKFLNF